MFKISKFCSIYSQKYRFANKFKGLLAFSLRPFSRYFPSSAALSKYKNQKRRSSFKNCALCICYYIKKFNSILRNFEFQPTYLKYLTPASIIGISKLPGTFL